VLAGAYKLYSAIKVASRWTKKAAVISDRTKTQYFAPALVQRKQTLQKKPKICPHNSEALYLYI
jgi:hypothetical protein